MTTELSSILSEIELRAEKATPGKWEAVANDDCLRGEEDCGHAAIKTAEHDPWHIARVWASGPNTFRDADFIAASRTDVPRLCAALRGAVDALKQCQQDRVSHVQSNPGLNPYFIANDALTRIAALFKEAK